MPTAKSLPPLREADTYVIEITPEVIKFIKAADGGTLRVAPWRRCAFLMPRGGGMYSECLAKAKITAFLPEYSPRRAQATRRTPAGSTSSAPTTARPRP